MLTREEKRIKELAADLHTDHPTAPDAALQYLLYQKFDVLDDGDFNNMMFVCAVEKEYLNILRRAGYFFLGKKPAAKKPCK